jgi:hypothetical protein
MDELDQYIKGQKKTAAPTQATTTMGTQLQTRPGGPIYNPSTGDLPGVRGNLGDLARGGLKTFGVEPGKPGESQAHETVRSLTTTGTGLAKSAWQGVKNLGPLAPIDMLASGIESGASNLENAYKNFDIHDPLSRHSLTAAGEGLGAGGQLVAMHEVPEAASEAKAAVTPHPDSAVPQAHQTILDLAGKTPADLEFGNTVKKALPDIAHAARTGGELQMEGNARVGELHERLQDRLSDIWHEEHQPQVERHAQMPVNLEDARNAAQAAITPELRANNPTAARAADRWINSALSDEAAGTVGQADKMLRGINAEIPNLPEPFKAVGKLARNAAAKSLRETIDTNLQAAGEEGVKGPNTRWGALKEVTDAIGDRLNNAGNRPFSIYDAFKGSHRLALTGAGLGAGLGEAVAGPTGAGIGSVVGGTAGAATSIMHDILNEPGHKASNAVKILAKSSLQPDTVGIPDYVGKKPIGLLNAAPSNPLITPAPRGLGLYANEAGVRGVDARHVEAYNPVGGPGQRNLQRPEYTGGKGRTDYPIPRPGSLTKPLEAPGPAVLDNQAVQSTVARQAPEVPVERRATARVATAENSPPVDNIRMARMDSLRKIVRDVTTPARDKAIAQSQLEDMEANPEERNTLGDNPSQLKKEKPLMSREEAEAASAKRTEGRTARFAERPAESPGPAELESKTSKRTKSKKGKK